MLTVTITNVATALALLAHQGGWDEVALVGAPIVVVIVVLALVKRRVDRMQGPPT